MEDDPRCCDMHPAHDFVATIRDVYSSTFLPQPSGSLGRNC